MIVSQPSWTKSRTNGSPSPILKCVSLAVCECRADIFQFNPVELALQLLDDASSSSGQGMQAFQQTKKRLSRALKGSVDSEPHVF